ncbi:MAG TPA: hypothetical protein GX503_01865, partial [Clostridiales bacterium]|nr:hypothetical protein [Clostridiales bacterium]
KGVKVKGDTIVNGGGTDSIYFENSVLVHIIVNKTDGKVRIVVSGTTRVEQVTLQSGATLEEQNLTGQGFEAVEIARELPEGSKVTLLGEFETVDIKAASIAVEIPRGTIENLLVDEDAENTEIEVAKESEIIKMIIDAVVKVVGKGSIKEAEVNAKNVTFEKEPEKSTGTEIPKTGSTSGGGGGGGSSKPKEVAVSAIRVEPKELILTVGETGKITATVEPEHATNKKVRWSSSDDKVVTVDANGKVTALASGTATITATTEDGGKTATCMVTVRNVLNITRKEGYDTIQEAIEKANAGDTIQVGAGNFTEELTIKKSLTILGINADKDARTSDFADNGSIVTKGIRITGKDVRVTINGLTIKTKGILASDIAGLAVVNNVIQDIRIQQDRDYLPSIVGIDIIDATEPIVIKNNVIANVGVDDGEGMGIRIMRASDNIDITDNIIKDVRHNGINIYQKCLTEENSKLTITRNEINNWDADKDSKDIGGRAIRIEFDYASPSATAVITGNKLIPPTYEANQIPVDSEYVKLTFVGIPVDLTGNYWGSASPDFATILLVEGTKATDCAYMPYYTDEAMKTLVSPPVINTTKNKGYDTINAAIGEAADEDVIKIAAGTYAEAVRIHGKSLTLHGADGTIITGGVIANANVPGKSITISGIEFKTAGLEVNGYDDVKIISNKFTDITFWTDAQLADECGDAIYVHGSETGTALIQGNIINGVKCDRVNIGDGIGITVLDLDNITIRGNKICNTWHNSVNIFRGVSGTVTIAENIFDNWDSNQDEKDDGTVSPGCEGGRAIRIDLAAGASIHVTGNIFLPNDHSNPADPDYVKITGVSDDKVSDLIESLMNDNEWPKGTDFSIVILINKTNGPKMEAGITNVKINEWIAEDATEEKRDDEASTEETAIETEEKQAESEEDAEEAVNIEENGIENQEKITVEEGDHLDVNDSAEVKSDGSKIVS